MRVAIAFASLFLTSFMPAHAEDPFADNPRGKLKIRMELSGSHRVDFPNGVEWVAIDARRSLDIEFELVDVGNDGLPIVSKGQAGADLSPAMEDLKGKIEACGQDQQCLARTMMEFAGAGGGNPFQAMTGQEPGRYRNFAGDRFGTCATGTVVVKDVLSGVYIPPPQPARAYRFTRNGSLALPHGNADVTDTICAVELTLDEKTGKVSFRIPAAKIPVPVVLGAGAFTDERSVHVIEGPRFIELFGQSADGVGVWSGSAEVVSAGSASHNSGQVSAPLKGRVEWRFSEE